ncbi:hypothetical protein B0H67DRAFT_556231 [Lasiosphaeris hirsuta]|uniref:Transcription factor domain-containing protein n=1 Tax=Lasiosphaeris hirsuta TaxID=260670 RepID=A0AA40A1L6_9PEZI|nr:hypothetical protein B0H67DRAFT_556231 [Lasiosphaeris hirsuta]
MASLKFIMDVNEDHQTDSRHTNKKDKDPGTPANTSQLFEASANIHPQPRDVSSTSLPSAEQNISQVAPAAQNKRRGASTRGPRSAAAAVSAAVVSSSLSSSSSSLSATTNRPPARRRSTASNDSMDQTGYGSAASSSSMGGRLQHHQHQHHHSSHSPMRPMPPHQPASDLPMRLTPITGRVSRAKKGVPVHVCDVCKPAKTFTRAEHLSEQEGDKASSKGGGNDDDQRASSAPSSIDERYPQRAPPLQQPPGGASPVVSGPGLRAIASPSTTEIPPTPSVPGSQRNFSQLSSPAIGSSPPTPQALGGGNSTYGPPGRTSQDYNNYPMPSSTVSIIDPAHPSSLTGPFQDVLDYPQPRTAPPPPIGLVTQGVSLPSLHIPEHRTPDLYHSHDASPWTSSTSDSTYSTPASASEITRQQRFWMTRRSPTTTEWPSTQLLSPYPGSTPRDLQSQGEGLEPMRAPPPPLFINPFPASSHFTPTPQQQTYGNMFDPMGGYGSAAGTTGHHSAMSNSSESTFRSHHQHGNSMSSIRSQTPPPNTSSHSGEALVTPSPALPSRLDALVGLGRQKEMAVESHHSLMEAQAVMGGIGVLDGLGVGYGGGDGDHGSGILAALDLPLGAGCGMPGTSGGLPLQRAVRAAIPEYLTVYWARVHPALPVVHRQSFEAAPEDVLRCAMAAVATQFLDGKEDRIRGNQLHEYALQEAKRATQWNLQIMQAILLCEYFARFRGRKAVTGTSKTFENLYSRVSSLQFFAASSSFSSTRRGSNALFIVDNSAWSPISSTSSDCSSCASTTPTNAAMSSNDFRRLSAAPSTPWCSFPSSYASSTSSFGNNISSSPSTSFTAADISFSLNDNIPPTFNHNTPYPPPSSLRPQRSWASLFSTGHYTPPQPSSLSFQARTQVAEQTYSQALSTLQVLYQNPSMFDNAVLAADHLSAEERWHNWVDTEARRRLLAACFHTDSHAALYQQQRRAHDWDGSGMSSTPPVPLFGRSSPLWEASSAEEWSAVLAADPGAGIPAFAPPPEQLTAQDVMSQMPYDQVLMLGIQMLQLPRRHLTSVASVSAHNSPSADGDSHMQHTGNQFDSDQQFQLQNAQQPDPAREAVALQVEERISTLFAGCPVANTYLALHHTPLLDLLAVGGDSWVFSQKVLPATSFQEHKKRLKLWAEQHSRPAGSTASAPGGSLAGLSAAKATVYAARAIVGFLERGYTGSVRTGMAPAWSADLSDYWGLYACALICWAFGHGHRARAVPTTETQQQHRRSSSGGSGNISPASRASSNTASAAADEEALTWLRMVAADSTRLEDVVRNRGRREAGGVVGLVRRQLERDCVGSRSRLYVDAVGVLRKLEEGANWKWF